MRVDEVMKASQGQAKPRLRGVSHQLAFFVFLLANTWLYTAVDGQKAKLAVLIYAGSLAFLYGVSATYHRRSWSSAGLRRMQRIDHSAIFVLIAGSHSPLFMLFGRGDFRVDPLLIVWLCAGLGVAKSVLWAHGPTWITALLAIVVGWSGWSFAVALIPEIGGGTFALLLISGVVYSLGAIVYALRRPDPLPKVFGYHEVFHVCVVAGSILHFAHTVMVLRAAGAL